MQGRVTDETRSPFGDDATLGGVWQTPTSVAMIQQGNDPIALKPLLRRGKRERRAPANFQGADVLDQLLGGLLQKDVSYITLHYIPTPTGHPNVFAQLRMLLQMPLPAPWH